MTDNIPEVPVIWYKNQRVWRTLFSGFLTILSVTPIVIGIVNDQYPAEWLVAAAAQALAVQAVLTRIMAIPAVNAFLVRFGLGSVPPSYFN